MGLFPIIDYGHFLVKKRSHNSEATCEEDDGFSSFRLSAWSYTTDGKGRWIRAEFHRRWWPLSWTEYGEYVNKCYANGIEPVIGNE